MRRRDRQDLTAYAAAIDGLDAALDAVERRAETYQTTGDAAVKDEVRDQVAYDLIPRQDAAEAAYATATVWSLHDVPHDVADGIDSVRTAYHDTLRKKADVTALLDEIGIDTDRARERSNAWYHHDDHVGDMDWDLSLDHPLFTAADLVERGYKTLTDTLPGVT